MERLDIAEKMVESLANAVTPPVFMNAVYNVFNHNADLLVAATDEEMVEVEQLLNKVSDIVSAANYADRCVVG